jgi:hypothetical protein
LRTARVFSETTAGMTRAGWLKASVPDEGAVLVEDADAVGGGEDEAVGVRSDDDAVGGVDAAAGLERVAREAPVAVSMSQSSSVVGPDEQLAAVEPGVAVSCEGLVLDLPVEARLEGGDRDDAVVGGPR